MSAPSLATASPKPQATRSTPFGSICTKPAPTSTTPARLLNRTWSWAGKNTKCDASAKDAHKPEAQARVIRLPSLCRLCGRGSPAQRARPPEVISLHQLETAFAAGLGFGSAFDPLG